MAVPRVVHRQIEYTVPQAVIDAAPDGQIYRHFAFFARLTGRWLGELAGYVPYPDPAMHLRGDRRQLALMQWMQAVIRGLGTRYQVVDEIWRDDCPRVPAAHEIALDVTRWAWPVGDHVYHRWVDIDQMLDWPESSGRKFIEVNVTELIGEDGARDGMELPVVAQQHGHQPLRHAVPGQLVLPVSGTPFEPYWGWIWGRFVRRGERWGFEPLIVQRQGRVDELWTAPEAIRRQLSEAPIDLDILQPAAVREEIAIWRSASLRRGTATVSS